jgi:protein phosphatase
MDIGYLTLRGKVREKDEDSLLVLSSAFAYKGKEDERAVAVLADGMGGGELGEVASRIAVTTFRNNLLPLLVSEAVDGNMIRIGMTEAFERTNAEIFSYSKNHQLSFMGTTATALFLYGKRALIGNVGDSRTYVIDPEGRVKFRTRDHSYVQELILSGEISEDEGRNDPRRNQLTRALGIERTIFADISSMEVGGGETILLCCDGLWGALSESELRKQAIRGESAQETAKILADEANENDGSDNISIIVLKI